MFPDSYSADNAPIFYQLNYLAIAAGDDSNVHLGALSTLYEPPIWAETGSSRTCWTARNVRGHSKSEKNPSPTTYAFEGLIPHSLQYLFTFFTFCFDFIKRPFRWNVLFAFLISECGDLFCRQLFKRFFHDFVYEFSPSLFSRTTGNGGGYFSFKHFHTDLLLLNF